jgi:hypothetical protein
MLKEFDEDTRVVHCQKEDYDVYIGRPSEWGNPYTHIKDKTTKANFIVKTRNEAISKYREWVLSQPHLIEKLGALKGKKLGCWCHPKKCHGDILIQLIREYDIRQRNSDRP